MGNCLGKFMQISYHSFEYRRDSFSDRVCNDLCEVIIQFLSLEDRYKLQFVSKQFQRTIFQKQCEIGNDFQWIDGKCPLEKLFERMSIQSFVSLLKRCPNITSLYLENNFRFLDHKDLHRYKWVNIVTNNCPNLSKVKLNTCRKFNQYNMDRLIEMFGPKLKCLECENFNFELVSSPKALNILKNVHELKLEYCDFENIQDYKFPNLKKLNVLIFEWNFENILRIVNNNPGIQRVSVTVNVSESDYSKTLFRGLSGMKNLIHIELIAIPLIHEIFYEVLPRMAHNCPKLKSICYELTCSLQNVHKINDKLSPFKRFKNLRRLDLSLEVSDGLENDTEHSIDVVTGLEHITHLSLSFHHNLNPSLMQKIVTSFLINSPKLQFLGIRPLFIITDRILELLSGLTSLKSVRLNLGWKKDEEKNKVKNLLLTNCKNITPGQIKLNSGY